MFVVDDERCIADTLAAILHTCGYEAIPFYNPMNALAECESQCPELVISDVMMPQMNGVELAILIRQRHPECKILLFSGQAATADILEDARGRGYDFELLAKPIHPKDLLAKLETETRFPPRPASVDTTHQTDRTA
ncbi:MAG: response regulator [Acidobacteriaceae bacterium]